MLSKIMEERKQKILSFMREESYKPLKFSELAVIMDVPKEDRPVLQELLDEMVTEGVIIKTKKNVMVFLKRWGW